VAGAQGRADPGGEVGAGEADRWFGGGHAVRPVWPVVAEVLEEPEDSLVGAVGRAAADAAEQAPHGAALAQWVDLAELGSAFAWTGRHSLPQHAVLVAVGEGLVGVGDTGHRMRDNGGGQELFGAPGRNVWHVHERSVFERLPGAEGAD